MAGPLGSLGKLFVEVGMDLAGVKKGKGELQEELGGLGGTIQKHGKAIGAAMTGVGMASLGVAYKSTQAFASFDQAMINTQSIAVGTQDQFDEMRKLSLKMATEMPQSAEEIANGYYYLASAGLNANQIMAVTPTTLKLATAAGADFSTTADVLTSTVMSMGYSFEDTGKVADVLMNTVTGFKTTLPELANSMKYVGASAYGLGVSLEETAASIGILRNNGLAAEQAGTALRAVFNKMTNISPKVQEQLSALGYEIQRNADGTFDYQGTLQSMAAALNQIEDPIARSTLLEQAFGTEAKNAAQILLNNVDAIERNSIALGELGATEEKSGMMMEGAGNKFKVATNAMNAASIQMGEAMAPATLTAAHAVSGFAGLIAGLPEPLQNVAGMGILAAGGIGSIGGPLMMMVASGPGFMTAVSGMATSIRALNLAFLGNPIVLAIMAIIAILAVIYLAWTNNWGGIQEKTQAVFEFLTGVFEQIKQLLTNFVTAAVQWLGMFGDKLLFLLGPIGAVIYAFRHWEEIKTLIFRVMNAVLTFLNGLPGRFESAGRALIEAFVRGITSKLNAAYQKTKEMVQRIRNLMPGSDAKEGPLSDITSSGAALMKTFSRGIESSGVNLNTTFERQLPVTTGQVSTQNRPADGAQGGQSINIGTVNLTPEYNFQALMKDIEAYQATQRIRRGIISI